MRANTDWFRDAKWGVFVHYLAGLPSADRPEGTTVAGWNERIDGFDVDGLARQLAEIEAGYLFITLGQNSGFMLAPNATYEALVPRRPSRLPLEADLGESPARLWRSLRTAASRGAVCGARRAALGAPLWW